MNPSHQVPGRVDPYEVAYLRGGRNELARVVIVSLVERQIIELQRPDSGSLRSLVRGSKYIAQKSTRPATRLSELEQTVHEWFAQPLSVADVFRQSLPEHLAPYCLAFEERLQRQQLLYGDDPIPAPIVVAGVLTIAAVGAWLTLAGLAAGAPVVLIIVMSVGGVAALLYFGVRRRLTAEGKAYLKQLRGRVGGHDGVPYAFAAAVAGTTALAGTSLADLGAEFKKSQRHDHANATGCGVGWGGGCGHGCGGGSGCGGGGGGGCGGGGCGGGS